MAHFVWATVVACAAALLGLAGFHAFDFEQPTFIGFPAVLVICMYLGVAPAIVCLSVFAIAAAYLFLPPLNSFAVYERSDLLEVASFVVISLAIVAIAQAYRVSRNSEQQFEPADDPLRMQRMSSGFGESRRDQVERHFANQLLEYRTAQLQTATGSNGSQQPQECETSLSTLATGLGHDICNIVLPILCHLDSLDTQQLPQAAVQELRAVRASVMHLRHLSGRLSHVAVDAESPAYSTESTPLTAWWADVEPILQRALPANVQLISDVPQGLGAVALPSNQLTQAVLNLVINAGEAIEQRGEVQVRCREGADANTIEISVTDTGRGMNDEIRKQALDPFFTTKKRSLSTGLGLSQVRSIVDSAGGHVSISSTARLGTTVTMTLPCADSEQRSQPKARRNAHVGIADQRIASYARTLLECTGFNVSSDGTVLAKNNSLWITDCAEDKLNSAREFLRGGKGRRVIVVGQPAAEWNEPGMIVVDGSHRAMQRELEKAAKDVS